MAAFPHRLKIALAGKDQAGRRSLAKVTRPYGGSDPEGGLVFSEELRYDVRDAVSAVIWAHGRSGVDVSEAQTYSFDDAGRLKEFTQGLWSAATGTVTGSPTARHDYTLDEQSNWREHEGPAGSARLSPSVNSINAYTNWPTDIDGNGTAEFKAPADPDDENRSIDGQLGFVWKKVEREVLRAGEDNPKQTLKHVHDGLGRLVEVLKNGVSQVRYGYTADGRLAWRREVAAGRTVWYVHDGRQVIQENQTAPSTVLVQEYCWQETTLLETRKPGGWIRTLHQDRLGSVVAATAGGGGTVTIEARTAYDPYGRPVSLPSWSAAGVESIVPFGYTGARWEDLAALDVDVDADGTVESVGLYAMGSRWYDAEMGRFLEQDPLGEVAGSNLYAYVDASPVMWVDPSGLMSEEARKYRDFPYKIRLPGGGLSGKGVYGGYSGRPKPRTTAGWLHDELRARRLEEQERFVQQMFADFEAMRQQMSAGERLFASLAVVYWVQKGAVTDTSSADAGPKAIHLWAVFSQTTWSTSRRWSKPLSKRRLS